MLFYHFIVLKKVSAAGADHYQCKDEPEVLWLKPLQGQYTKSIKINYIWNYLQKSPTETTCQAVKFPCGHLSKKWTFIVI